MADGNSTAVGSDAADDMIPVDDVPTQQCGICHSAVTHFVNCSVCDYEICQACFFLTLDAEDQHFHVPRALEHFCAECNFWGPIAKRKTICLLPGQMRDRANTINFLEQEFQDHPMQEGLKVLLTQELLDIEVNYEIVDLNEFSVEDIDEPIHDVTSEQFVETPEVEEEQDFVINEIVSDIREVEVIDVEHLMIEEENQISFQFDLPLEEKETSTLASPLLEQKSTEIPCVEIPTTDVLEEAPTVFQLEETETSVDSIEPINESVLNDIEVDFKVVSMDEALEKIVEPSSDINPFDRSINESVNLVNEKRKEQLKKFNYTFKNNINRIEEMEKQPAYKRMGFDIDAAPEQGGTSQMSLDSDSNDDIQFRSNNSFLHDNVD